MQTRQSSKAERAEAADPAELAASVPSSAPETPKKKVVVRKKPQRKSKWNAENIMTDPKSPLATADLRSILGNPLAWDALDKAEQEEVLALFPDNQHITAAGTPDARPNFASLMNDDSFRHDCAAYVENVKLGRHDPEWLASAWAAHERRKAGDFDEYLEQRFRDDWEVEIPEEMRTRRGGPAFGQKREGSTASEATVSKGAGEDQNGKDTKADEATSEANEDMMEVDNVEADETKDEEMPNEAATSEKSTRQRAQSVDELQAADAEHDQTKAKDSIMVQVLDTRMDVDGENSVDELA